MTKLEGKEFIPVRLSTLRSDEVVPFDVFIYVANHQIHYIRRGDPFEKNRIDSLRSKGVHKLFIPLECEKSYLGYLDAGLQQLQNASMAVEKRTTIANSTLMNLAGSADRAIETEFRYRDMENRVQKVLGFLGSENGIARKMLDQSGVAQDELQHASNVNTLALILAEKVGIKAPKDLLTLSMAALMHDIGKVGLPIDPKTPREKLTLPELELFKTHPQRGADMVADKPYINPAIVSLIANHEEMGNGAGFPNKKRIETLPLVQQVLNICNEYDRVCTQQCATAFQATKLFFLEKVGLFPLPLVQALAEVLKTG
ncbi:MAG: HD domain-containing protein [Oligoflexia bacterium]|nr:HD domain-containing protein [Oligoflexia bacterium]